MAIEPAVYIMASGRNDTIYIGVTANLIARVHQHREGLVEGFTKRHGVNRLVWFKMHNILDSAIPREKQLKAWRRAWKIALVEESNPTWRDLAEDIGFPPLASSP